MPTITKIFDVPPAETDAEHKAKELLAFANELQHLLFNQYDKLYKGLWHSGATVEDILAAMGPNAVQFFIKASAFVEFMETHCNVVFEPHEKGAKVPLIFHEDGTVTIAPPEE